MSDETVELKKVTPEMVKALNAPLPPEAIKQHPTKKYLSTIKVIYCIERLNEVFGIGKWRFDTEVLDSGQMVVVKGWLRMPEYGIEVEAYGGNDNPDRGDAFKGARTDALSKACAEIGIGMAVYKGQGDSAEAHHQHIIDKADAQPKPNGGVQSVPKSALGRNMGRKKDFEFSGDSPVIVDIFGAQKSSWKNTKTGELVPLVEVETNRGAITCWKKDQFDTLISLAGSAASLVVVKNTKGKWNIQSALPAVLSTESPFPAPPELDGTHITDDDIAF